MCGLSPQKALEALTSFLETPWTLLVCHTPPHPTILAQLITTDHRHACNDKQTPISVDPAGGWSLLQIDDFVHASGISEGVSGTRLRSAEQVGSAAGGSSFSENQWANLRISPLERWCRASGNRQGLDLVLCCFTSSLWPVELKAQPPPLMGVGVGRWRPAVHKARDMKRSGKTGG